MRNSTLQRAMTVGSTNDAPSESSATHPRAKLRPSLTRDETVGKGREGVEDEGDTEDLLLPGEPGGYDEGESGERQGFEEAEQESTHGETGKAVRRGDAHGDDAPDDDVDGDDFAGLESLHELQGEQHCSGRAGYSLTNRAGKTEIIWPKKISDELPFRQPSPHVFLLGL